MEKPEQTPFAELPEALVEEMLSKNEQNGDRQRDTRKMMKLRSGNISNKWDILSMHGYRTESGR